MSYYEDERRSRHKSTKDRHRDNYDDMSYDNRDSKTIVRRRDDSVSSVEEVTRDFPPGERGGAVYRETTVRKSGHRPVGSRSKSYDDDEYYDSRYDSRSNYSGRTRRGHRDDDTYVSRRSSRKYDDRGKQDVYISRQSLILDRRPTQTLRLILGLLFTQPLAATQERQGPA